jgi:iron(III) transport system permease protein
VLRWWPWLVAAAAAYLVVLPLGSLVYGALRTDSPGTPDSAFTADWLREVYVELFTGGAIQRVVWHSIEIAVPTTVLATVVGVALSWLIARTDMPGRGWFEFGLIIPMFYSPLVGIIGWTVLAAPQGGWLNHYWAQFTGGSASTLNIYSTAGIVWVMALFYLPYAVIFNVSTFRGLDATHEEAAAISGAPKWRSIASVTLPLMRPSIFAAGIFIFIFCLEQFTIPGALGSQSRFDTLAYSIYLDVKKYPSNPGLAAAKGTLLLVLTVILLLAYRRILRRANRYVTMGPKGQRPSEVKLGGWRWVATGFCVLILFLGTVLPLVAIGLRSLMASRTIGIDWASLGVSAYQRLMASPDFFSATRNSVVLSVAAAVLAAVIGIAVAVATLRMRGNRAAAIADYLLSAPVAVPGTVFGIGLMWAYIGSPLYQSLALLLIAFITRYAVFGVRMVGAGLMQVDKSLSEAALVSGASRLRALRSVDLPLLSGAISGAWLLVFLSVMREVATTIIIYGVNSRTLAVLTWNYTEDGFYDIASGLAVAQVVLVVVIVMLVKLVFGSRVRVKEAIGSANE